MVPFFFGASQRRLFGAYDPTYAAKGSSRGAVLICYPWSSEYLFSHRSLRQLASKLSQNGFETLRFDYFGTGDSGGNVADADFAGWENDIESAIQELSDLAGIKKVVLVGLRLGANLATSVAKRRSPEVSSIVLWDPIVSGKSYLRQSCVEQPRKSALFRSQSRTPSPKVSEFDGVPIAADLVSYLETLDLTDSVADIPVNTLIVLSSRLPWYAALQSAVQRVPKRPLKLEFVEDIPAWLDRPGHTATVPVKVIDRIIDWLVQCK
jgi:pimeloyl-ACP methyl ester carboxylesterase